jgi:hypothetical protein
MSVLRQANLLGQGRVDVPHLRSIESSICADFDVIAGRIMAGSKPLIVSGFDSVTTGMVGQPATNLQVNVANAVVMHQNATESGTILWVPSNRAVEVLNATNTRVIGGFSANTTNYISIDLIRSTDATTTDLVQFLNPQTNLETPKSVPLARTLDYTIHISTQDFSTTPGLCPIALVVTDTSNNILTITDARNKTFRLGPGGSVPNAQGSYSWPGGRTEVGDNSDFNAGDKVINSMKDWCSAIMTRLWELGGGQYWYSPTNTVNVQMVRAGSTFTNGQYFEWTGTNLHWQGLTFLFDNSTAANNVVVNQLTDSPGLTDLADGQCIYVDVNRVTNGATINAAKATLATLGTPLIPGSRFVIAWRSGANIFTRNSDFAVGTQFGVATPSALGVVKLSVTSGTPAAPVVVALDANGIGNNTNTTASQPGLQGTGGTNGAGVSGIGGATGGTGVLAQGTGTGTGVDATGGVTGAGIVSHGVANNNNAQYLAKDSAGNVRSVIDHIGYRVGRFTEWRENWSWYNNSLTTATNYPTAYGPWNAQSITANCSISTVSPANQGDANPTSNVIRLLAATAVNTNAARLFTTYGIFSPQTFVSCVLEWDMAMTGIGANNVTYAVGWASTTNSALSSCAAGFVKRSTDTNWQAVTGGGGTITDTGVAPSLSNNQRFRIELHGSATPFGTEALFFINDVLVATITTNVPVGTTDLYLQIAMDVTGTTAANQSLWVGPMLAVWNRWLSLPAV